MSIDYLMDLERDLGSGKAMYSCPGLGKNQWIIARSATELKKMAQRVADNRKIAVTIVRLVLKNEALAGDMFLVPIQIGEPGGRGEPQIQWSTIDTKEAAEMMRDVRKGPSPFFAMQVQETIQPSAACQA